MQAVMSGNDWRLKPCRFGSKFRGGKHYPKTGKSHRQRSHRWLWKQMHGPIPAGLLIHHLCENKDCLEVGHLALVTRSEHGLLHRKLRSVCQRGHPMDGQNKTQRFCRTCRAVSKRRYKEKRKQP